MPRLQKYLLLLLLVQNICFFGFSNEVISSEANGTIPTSLILIPGITTEILPTYIEIPFTHEYGLYHVDFNIRLQGTDKTYLFPLKNFPFRIQSENLVQVNELKSNSQGRIDIGLRNPRKTGEINLQSEINVEIPNYREIISKIDSLPFIKTKLNTTKKEFSSLLVEKLLSPEMKPGRISEFLDQYIEIIDDVNWIFKVFELWEKDYREKKSNYLMFLNENYQEIEAFEQNLGKEFAHRKNNELIHIFLFFQQTKRLMLEAQFFNQQSILLKQTGEFKDERYFSEYILLWEKVWNEFLFTFSGEEKMGNGSLNLQSFKESIFRYIVLENIFLLKDPEALRLHEIKKILSKIQLIDKKYSVDRELNVLKSVFSKPLWLKQRFIYGWGHESENQDFYRSFEKLGEYQEKIILQKKEEASDYHYITFSREMDKWANPQKNDENHKEPVSGKKESELLDDIFHSSVKYLYSRGKNEFLDRVGNYGQVLFSLRAIFQNSDEKSLEEVLINHIHKLSNGQESVLDAIKPVRLQIMDSWSYSSPEVHQASLDFLVQTSNFYFENIKLNRMLLIYFSDKEKLKTSEKLLNQFEILDSMSRVLENRYQKMFDTLIKDRLSFKQVLNVKLLSPKDWSAPSEYFNIQVEIENLGLLKAENIDLEMESIFGTEFHTDSKRSFREILGNASLKTSYNLRVKNWRRFSVLPLIFNVSAKNYPSRRIYYYLILKNDIMPELVKISPEDNSVLNIDNFNVVAEFDGNYKTLLPNSVQLTVDNKPVDYFSFKDGKVTANLSKQSYSRGSHKISLTATTILGNNFQTSWNVKIKRTNWFLIFLLILLFIILLLTLFLFIVGTSIACKSCGARNDVGASSCCMCSKELRFFSGRLFLFKMFSSFLSRYLLFRTNMTKWFSIKSNEKNLEKINQEIRNKYRHLGLKGIATYKKNLITSGHILEKSRETVLVLEKVQAINSELDEIVVNKKVNLLKDFYKKDGLIRVYQSIRELVLNKEELTHQYSDLIEDLGYYIYHYYEKEDEEPHQKLRGTIEQIESLFQELQTLKNAIMDLKMESYQRDRRAE